MITYDVCKMIMPPNEPDIEMIAENVKSLEVAKAMIDILELEKGIDLVVISNQTGCAVYGRKGKK